MPAVYQYPLRNVDRADEALVYPTQPAVEPLDPPCVTCSEHFPPHALTPPPSSPTLFLSRHFFHVFSSTHSIPLACQQTPFSTSALSQFYISAHGNNFSNPQLHTTLPSKPTQSRNEASQFPHLLPCSSFFDHSNIIPFKTCTMMISAPITADDMVSQLRSFFNKEEKQKGPRGVDSLAVPHLMAYSPIKDTSDWIHFTVQQLVEVLNRISEEGKESRIQDLWGFGMDRIGIKSWVYRPITEQRETIRPSPIMTFWFEGHFITAKLETILRRKIQEISLKMEFTVHDDHDQ
jgi:hypothetical protein